MARKDDRRIQKTRKQLRDSMLELILDRGYDDISIQDVTDRANLGRATFYLHYREKDDLYADVIRSIAEEFIATLPKQDPKKGTLFNTQSLKQLFNFVENHYDLYRIIIMGRGAMLTYVMLTDIVKDYLARVAKACEPDFESLVDVPSDFMLSFNASALISTVFWWLENNTPYSAEEMARMYEKMSFFSNLQVLRSAKILQSAEGDAFLKQPEEKTQADEPVKEENKEENKELNKEDNKEVNKEVKANKKAPAKPTEEKADGECTPEAPQAAKAPKQKPGAAKGEKVEK